jgi:DNA-binding transcriptional regulator GbsR (MarR family)
MDPVTTIPPDASWQQLVYALFMLALPALFTYLERLRRDIKDNTSKTENINHSLNGDLDKRLNKLAQDIGEAIAESHSELDRRISVMDDRIASLEERIFRQQ